MEAPGEMREHHCRLELLAIEHCVAASLSIFILKNTARKMLVNCHVFEMHCSFLKTKSQFAPLEARTTRLAEILVMLNKSVLNYFRHFPSS